MTLRDNPRAYAIMGCAKRVHATLGFGFLESAYGDALEIEWAQVVHYLRATRIPHALLVNFGRPTLQYDTFDLDRLPSGASPYTPVHCGEAAATNIPLPKESGSMARSVGGSGAPLATFGVSVLNTNGVR